jgi:transposase
MITNPDDPPDRGRGASKFTPQAIEKIKQIKQFVAEGMSRDEIANRLGVTVGSLQVTCSRLDLACDELSPPRAGKG